MSIQDRIEDAQLLWQSGRREGAFLSVLVGVAGIANSKYPNKGDRERFEKFIQDASSVSISVEFRGKIYPIETILYKFMRCELVHAGGLPPDIEFKADEQFGVMSVRAGGAPLFVLQLGTGWYTHLLQSLKSGTEGMKV